MNSDTQPQTSQELCIWVEEHSEYLLQYALRYFRARDVAEDVVQETFLAAVEGFRKFEARSSPRTWLVGILRHKIMDRIRKKVRETPVDESHLEQENLEHLFDSHEHWHVSTGPLSWDLSPEVAVQNRQFMAALQDCLSKLPQRFREIFLLKEMDELSRDEIADKLNLKSNHVGVLLFRARTELQQCLHVNWLKSPEAVRG